MRRTDLSGRPTELPASDTHDVIHIHHGGAVVAVVVPIAEY